MNLLLALAWPTHIHHTAAHTWFAENADSGWATCQLTQLGFVRLSMQPAVVKFPVIFGDAFDSLGQSTSHPAHRFWTLDSGLDAIAPEIRGRIMGHQQLTDALLLNLAIAHGGQLATFDKRIAALLPPDSPHRSALTLIPA